MDPLDEMIIAGSQTSGDDTVDTESKDASDRVLATQGIIIEQQETGFDASSKHLGDFSRELMEEGGIEIVQNSESEMDDESYL